MFDDNYKKAFDSISLDDNTKQRILTQITEKAEEKPKQKNKALPYRIGFAAVAAAAVVLCSIFVPKTSVDVKKKGKAKEIITSKLTYSQIYESLSELKSNPKLLSYGQDMEMVDDIAVNTAEGGTSYKASAAPTDYNSGAATSDGSHSNTNVQVDGVDEADIIKTDGKYIYYLNENCLKIVSADGENTRLVSNTELKNDGKSAVVEMYLYKNLAVIISTDYSIGETELSVFDISKSASPTMSADLKQSGNYHSSRMIDGKLYLITSYRVNLEKIDGKKPETFVPSFTANGKTECADEKHIMCYKNIYTSSYTVTGGFDITAGALISDCSVLGGSDIVYCSGNNIILTSYDDAFYMGDTVTDSAIDRSAISKGVTVSRFEIENGNITYKATGSVEGTIEDQFSIDEHKGNFFFVSTLYNLNRGNQYSALTVLDKDLKQIGKIDKIAQGERVYSTRFMGDTCYFVTFKQTDPLFSADISDPRNPKIIGELKLPGFSEYMYPYGENQLLGIGSDADETTGRVGDLKLSMFDISDNKNVTEKSKTVLEGITSSPALYSHKAVLLDANKNLIGFVCADYHKPAVYYKIFSFDNGEFVNKLDIRLDTEYESGKKMPFYHADSSRAVFAGDNIYIINGFGTWVYSLNDYSFITKTIF